MISRSPNLGRGLLVDVALVGVQRGRREDLRQLDPAALVGEGEPPLGANLEDGALAGARRELRPGSELVQPRLRVLTADRGARDVTSFSSGPAKKKWAGEKLGAWMQSTPPSAS